MRNLSTLFILLFCGATFASAQALQPVDHFFLPVNLNTAKKATPAENATPQPYPAIRTCTDTVLFSNARGTGFRALTINNATSADKIGMYFDAPQTMTISGFDFYAWITEEVPDTITLTGSLYLTGPDSLPFGSALGTGTVTVDSNFYAGSFAGLRKSIVFPFPITLAAAYVLVVESPSPLGVAVVTNDWEVNDGNGDWYGMASLPGTGWTHGYGLNVGGLPFDCDVLIEPYISYELNTEFTVSDSCLNVAGAVTFSNIAPSNILLNRFYNQHAFAGTPFDAFQWNWGDGSPIANVADDVHAYAAPGPYTVTLSHEMLGWNSTCINDTSMTIGGPNVAGLTVSPSGLLVSCFDASSGGTEWLWDFGDGSTSTMENPIHIFASAGTYEICLTSSNPCATDSACKTLTLCDAPDADFSFVEAGGTVTFTNITSGGIDVAYSWNFGDGSALSTDENPVHTFTAGPGIYIVCLTATDSCATDSKCREVEVGEVGLEDGPLAQYISQYPNPIEQQLNLELNLPKAQPVDVRLYDLQGKAISTQNLGLLKQAKISLDASSLPHGMYFLHIQAGDEVLVKRVIK